MPRFKRARFKGTKIKPKGTREASLGGPYFRWTSFGRAKILENGGPGSEEQGFWRARTKDFTKLQIQ